MEAASPNTTSKALTAPVGRRFQLFDAIFLVAATAVACGITRLIDYASDGTLWSGLSDLYSRYINQSPVVIDNALYLIDVVLGTMLYITVLTLPFFAAWTLSLIPIRQRFPRPRLRRLANQPGMIATCAVGVSFVFAFLRIGISLLVLGSHSFLLGIWIDEPLLELAHAASYPGLAVLASWATLLLGGRWYAEPSWIDGLGRFMGAYWIAIAAAHAVLIRLS